MASEWGETQLSRIAKLRSGFPFKSSSWVEDGVPVIKIANVKDGRIVADGCGYVSHETAATTREWMTQKGDVLIAMTGYVGEVARVRSGEKYLINQRVGRFDFLDDSPVIPEFFFYYLRQPEVRSLLETMARGSAQPNLSASDAAKLWVPVPPPAEQRAIAHILGTLDDKIELNRKQNETLEAMASALFKAWFVDFEPVRAKMENRWQRNSPLPPGEGLGVRGLPAHLYDLFPDRLVESELGEIPEGWEVASVDVEFDVTMGQSPPGNTYNEIGEGLPFYQGRSDFEFRFPKRRVYCTAPTRLAKNGDTLVSVRAPVGDINMASEDCAIGRGVGAVRHKTGCRSYTYQFMSSISDVFARFDAEGTVFGSIGKKDFHSISHVKPPRDLVLAYEKLVAQPDDQIERSERESRSLAQLRDTLLPKLISGELRVPDAEAFLKARGL